MSQPNVRNLRAIADTSDEVIRALKSLDEKATSRDMWLIYIILQKVDFKTRQAWAQHSNEEFPTFENFLEFLNNRCASLELCNEPNEKNDKGFNNPKIVSNDKLKCYKCNGSHPLYKCVKFKGMGVTARKNLVKKYALCFLCLQPHFMKNCNAQLKCNICHLRNHNTLLHEDKNSNAFLSNSMENETRSENADSRQAPNSSSFAQSTEREGEGRLIISSAASAYHSGSFLPTASVNVLANTGEMINLKLLLDSGSESSFISESAVQKLALKRKNNRIPLKGIGAFAAGLTRGIVSVKIKSRLNDDVIQVHAHVLNKLTSQLPAKFIDVKDLDYIKGIPLADPEFMYPKEIDMILGVDYFFSVLKCGQIVGSKNDPVAQNTIFGWVIAGKMNGNPDESKETNSHFINLEENLNVDAVLQKFWETEELPVKEQYFTEEEEFCENHFKRNYRINEEGRFVVKLPVIKDDAEFVNSKALAVSRLLAMEKKFERSPELEKEYKSFMSEYEELGHMKPVERDTNVNNSNKVCYLPHHAVVKADSITTKLRVVFDGSCKTPNGHSLNSSLGVGPTLQKDIFSILIKFRVPEIAFSADIKQMYRQILISEEDQDLQRIVWRSSKEANIKEYKLSTVTYGTASAPFLATRALWQIGLDNEQELSRVSSLIKDAFYMDDLMAGSNDIQEAITTVRKLSEVLSSRGFRLRKWRSNSPEFLSHISTEQADVNDLEIHPDECSKALGLLWNSSEDLFIFKVDFKFENEITKRSFLSQSAKLFDPLGLISPCTILVKMFYQQLWLMKLDWDTPLPDKCREKWKSFQRNFEKMSVIQIPRWIHTSTREISLHGFCDASGLAYAAVIYAVQPEKDGKSRVTILVAKSKVAPLKPMTIPRLELNGARLLARLYSTVAKVLSEYSLTFHAWTDSQVVLAWLSSPPGNWKPFVANRTAEILDVVPSRSWNHVPSKQNPADVASRGLSPNLLSDCDLWFRGPSWLSMSEEHWPKGTFKNSSSSDSKVMSERKKNSVYSVTIVYNDVIDSLFNQFSILTKIIDILAYCIRFVTECKEKVRNPERVVEEGKYSLSASERKMAGTFIISYVQSVYFFEELGCLRDNKPLKKSSSLRSLFPFIDSDGLLRVGGRLQNSQISYNAKHPIILPANHKLSKLLIRELHVTHLHAGVSLLSNILRQNYWIIQSKRLIRSHIKKCVTCHRYKVSSNNQLMSALPPQRVTLDRPFSNCGLDYAGPITLKFNKGRGAKTTKGYIALFVCMATKAYHIEAVSDMTSEAFIAALRRFIARRGVPSCMYSDNGSNFVGAKRKLSDLQRILRSNQNDEEISNFISKTSFNWKMIPPSAPHFGGIWEAGIKAVKFHLKRVIGETILTFEELSTLLVQIEAVLNSRPLVKVNDAEIASLDVLTPSHFLVGDVITSLPDRENISTLKLVSRWELVQKIKECFWKRYHKEYLNSLQQRFKWVKEQRNLVIGDIVLLKEDNLPPGRWPLGRVIDVHPGKDGLVRVVTVKTAAGQFKRPIVKLSPLQLDQE